MTRTQVEQARDYHARQIRVTLAVATSAESNDARQAAALKHHYHTCQVRLWNKALSQHDKQEQKKRELVK